jgi:ABC-type transporter Mla subunit MlaD
MRYHFNPYEKSVGLFLIVSLLGSALSLFVVMIHKNFFSEKIEFYVKTHTAANLRLGSSVHLSGMRVGAISDIDLSDDQAIKVELSLLKKYQHHFRQGLFARFTRPLIIGERTIVLETSQKQGDFLKPGTEIPLQKSTDIIELVTGPDAVEVFKKIDRILGNVEATTTLGKNIVNNLEEKQYLQKLLHNVTQASMELKRAPKMAQETEIILANLSTLTTQLKSLEPALKTLAQKVPEGSEKTLKLIDESILVLQAMQKNFFLKSGVKEVKEERQRAPAQSNP